MEGSLDIDRALPIEDYALLGDCHSGALVGRNGSIDWLCWPRFDGDACFAALLGDARHGRWLLAPADRAARVDRAYRGDTMVLETTFETAEGTIAVIDFMPTGRGVSSIVRRVEGRTGRVPVRMELTLRFNYGSSIPWVTQVEGGSGVQAVCGPNLVVLRTEVALEGRDQSTLAAFEIGAGENVDFTLSWGPSHLALPEPFDAGAALARTEAFWREWSARCEVGGPWRAPVMRSLLTLKALIYAPTGGIVAALTTSLPEQLGGPRNWDYRYCWLRDSSLTLMALMRAGYYDEAQAWRDWLHRAVAGNPGDLQIMYGIAGERRMVEWTASWLPGYEGATPVRVGNAAWDQLQLDVYGEMSHALHLARTGGLAEPATAWAMQSLLVEHVIAIWEQPDDGIWEMRGGRRHFTHSKVMAWVAVEHAVRDAEAYGYPAPFDRWRAARDHMHATICDKGFDTARNTFTQSYGDTEVDASLLLLPVVHFLPPNDPRMLGTVAAIERDLLVDGFVLRYRTQAGADGLPPGEGAFLPCSFWLADIYAMQGRQTEADALFARLLGLVNDIGLLSEEYDPVAKRQVGNVPQAFSHLALIRTAITIGRAAASGEDVKAER